MLSCESKEHTDLSYLCIFILYSYNSFVLLCEQSKEIYDCYQLLILKSLVKISKISTLGCYAFVQQISKCIKNEKFDQKILNVCYNFFYKNDNIKEESYLIFVDIFDYLIWNRTKEKKEMIPSALSILSMVQINNPNKFTKNVSIQIFESLNPLLLNSDLIAMETITHFKKIIPKNYLINLIPNLLKSTILNITCLENPLIKLEMKEGEVIHYNLKPMTSIEQNFNFFDNDAFPNGFEIIDKKMLPDNVKIFKYLFKDLIISKLSFISEFISECSEAILLLYNTFIDIINSKIDNERYFDLILAFLFIFKNFKDLHIFPNIAQFLFSHRLFDPKYICSIDDKSSYELNSIRSKAFSFILSSGSASLNYILEKSIQTPKLFIEILFRCLEKIKAIKKIIVEENNLIDTFTNSLFYYYKLLIQGEQESANVIYVLFLILSNLFLDDKIENLFFSNSDFTNTFLSFLFEDSMQSFILSKLRNLFIKQISLDNEIWRSITSIICKCCISINAKSLRLLSLIISILNQLIINYQSNSDFFCIATSSFLHSFSYLESTENCKSYLLICFQYFTNLSNIYHFSTHDCILIRNAIYKTYLLTPPKIILSKLIRIIASTDCMVEEIPNFRIRQENIVPVLFYVFNETQYIYYVLDFISNLCSFSDYNSFLLHKSNFDQIILNTLHKIWWSESIDKVYVEKLFNIFSKVAFVSSSYDVVFSFFSLISSKNDIYLSKYFELWLNCLNKIIMNSFISPISFEPLSDKIITTTNLRISNGFVFSCFVKFNSFETNYNPILFYAKADNCCLKISLSSNFIVFYRRSSTTLTNIKDNFNFKLGQWSYLTFIYTVNDNHDKFEILINHDIYKSYDIKHDSILNNVNVSFGGLEKDSKNTEDPVLIGFFAIFPLFTKNKINKYHKLTPRKFVIKLNKSTFSYVPDIKLENGLFVDILVYQCKIVVLLPLFYNLDCLLGQNGEKINNLAELTLSILSKLLLLDKDIENQFYSIEGFKIISDLLISCATSNINYNLYLSFYSLLQNIYTTELQENLIDSIIFNLDIWIACDNDQHLRILKNLYVFLSTNSYLSINISKLLNYYILYYSDDLANENIKQRRNKNLNLKACKKILFNIIIANSQKSFTYSDLDTVLTYANKIQDDVTMKLLDLILRLFDMTPSPLQKISNLLDIFPKFYALFKKNSNIAQFSLFIIFKFYQSSFIDIKYIYPTIELIIYYFPKENMNKTLFDYLSKITLQDLPDILPLCFWIGFNCSDGELMELLYIAQPNKIYCKNPLWFKWPLTIMFLEKDKSLVYKIIQFITKCDIDCWMNIIEMIIILGKSLKCSYEEYINLFLSDISSQLLFGSIQNTKKILSSFIELSKFFIFYRDSSEPNILERFIDNSSYSNQMLLNDNKSNNSEINPLKIMKKISKFNSDSINFYYGIRINEQFQWKDNALAQNIIELILKNNLREFLNLDFILCLFLQKNSPNLVNMHLNLLNITEQEFKSNRNLITMISFYSNTVNDSAKLAIIKNSPDFEGKNPLSIIAKWKPKYEFRIIKEISVLWKYVTEHINL